MIAQARITSDTSATVHLAVGSIDLTGADLPAIRAQVKDVFIAAAREADEALDVVIVEPDVLHHLRVEPSGRISGRPADDRPLYGPTPEVLPDPAAEATGEHAAVPDSPDTGEHPVDDEDARPHRARRRRAAAAPTTTVPAAPLAPGAGGSAGSAGSAATPDSAPTPGSATHASAGSPADTVSPVDEAPDAGRTADDRSGPASPAAVAPPSSAHSALSAPTPTSAPSAASAPSAGSSAPSAPTGVSAASPAGAPSPWAPAAGAPATRPGTTTRPGADPSRGASARPDPARASAPAPADDDRPTLQDLQASTARPTKVKAARGWQGALTRLTGGVIAPRPGRKERTDTERLERIRRPLEGPRNIAVVNLKGGAHKTTASLMIAATLGVTRGGNVLAWDNNETRGTLGWRGIPTDHHRTAVDLLHDIERLRAADATAAELDPYVRPQGAMRFDILASDEDPGSMASIDEHAFGELNDALSRFYRIKVIDTGNNVRASNWLAAVRDADQLVIVSTVREDTFNAAAWMIDELRATGLASQVDHAVTILSHSSKGKFDPVLRQRLLTHFGSHTRAVAEVPYEQQFVDGSHLNWERVSPATKKAWLDATALIIDGL